MLRDGSDDISTLCSVITGFVPEDFEEETPALFFQRLYAQKTSIENFRTARSENMNNTYAILLKGRPIKTFNGVDNVSNVGRILFSELTAILSEYGQAIDLGEKRQILLDVLDKLDNPNVPVKAI